MKIIYDKDLLHIKVIDNKEPLVEINKFSRDIKVSLMPESRKFFGKNICLVRKSVAIKLSAIQKELGGMKLVIYDGYRPLELQKGMYDGLYAKISEKNPGLSSEEIHNECSKFIAPVLPGIVTPHSTGGAVDVSIERDGKLLNMGTMIEEFSKECTTASGDIPEEAIKNRKLLIKLMKSEGFVNYPLEWWHWSYGDRTWAYYAKKELSIYDTVPYKGGLK